jgi:hypothetical protein
LFCYVPGGAVSVPDGIVAVPAGAVSVVFDFTLAKLRIFSDMCKTFSSERPIFLLTTDVSILADLCQQPCLPVSATLPTAVGNENLRHSAAKVIHGMAPVDGLRF